MADGSTDTDGELPSREEGCSDGFEEGSMESDGCLDRDGSAEGRSLSEKTVGILDGTLDGMDDGIVEGRALASFVLGRRLGKREGNDEDTVDGLVEGWLDG